MQLDGQNWKKVILICEFKACLVSKMSSRTAVQAELFYRETLSQKQIKHTQKFLNELTLAQNDKYHMFSLIFGS